MKKCTVILIQSKRTNNVCLQGNCFILAGLFSIFTSTPTLSGLNIVYAVGMAAQEFFFENFDFINECKNEFKGNNENSCSWSRNRVSRKVDFKAASVLKRNGYHTLNCMFIKIYLNL